MRKAVLERDGYQCTEILPSGARCPAAASDVDHDQAMTDDHSRMHSKCRPHHAVKSAREGGQASGQQAKRRAAQKYRPREAHPGWIPEGGSR